MAVSELRAQAQFAAKKRCRVCNSSNPLTAQSCDICGSAFEPAQVSSAMPATAMVAASTPATTRPAPAASRKSAQTTASVSAAPQRSTPAAPARKASNGQSAGPAPKPRPAARQSSRDAALAQFLRGDDAAAVAPEPSYAPMMAWVIVSFVVLVLAVVATAVILTNSTVNNEIPAGVNPDLTRTSIAAMPSTYAAHHAWATIIVSHPDDRAAG